MSRLKIEESGHTSFQLLSAIWHLCKRHKAKIQGKLTSPEREDTQLKFILKGSRKALKRIRIAIKHDKRFINIPKFM